MEERSRGPVKKRPRASNSFSSASADSSPSMSPIAIDSREDQSTVNELMVSNSTRSDNSTGPSHTAGGITAASNNTMSTRDSDNNSSSNSTSNRVTSITRCKRRNQSTASTAGGGGGGGGAYDYEEEETPINNTTTSSLVAGEIDSGECDDDHVDASGGISGSRRINSSPASSTSHVSIMSPVDVNVNSPERAASATPSVTKSPHSMSPRSPVMSPRSNASPVQQSNGSVLASNSSSSSNHHHHHHHHHHHSQQSSSLHQASSAGSGEGHLSGHQSSGNTSGVTSSVSNSHHRFHPYASPELHLPPPLGATVFHPASLSHFVGAGSASPSSSNGHLTASHLSHLAAASQSALLSCSSPPNASPGASGSSNSAAASTTNSTAAAAAAAHLANLMNLTFMRNRMPSSTASTSSPSSSVSSSSSLTGSNGIFTLPTSPSPASLPPHPLITSHLSPHHLLHTSLPPVPTSHHHHQHSHGGAVGAGAGNLLPPPPPPLSSPHHQHSLSSAYAAYAAQMSSFLSSAGLSRPSQLAAAAAAAAAAASYHHHQQQQQQQQQSQESSEASRHSLSHLYSHREASSSSSVTAAGGAVVASGGSGATSSSVGGGGGGGGGGVGGNSGPLNSSSSNSGSVGGVGGCNISSLSPRLSPSTLTHLANSASRTCPICGMSLEGVDVASHFYEEVQKIDSLRNSLRPSSSSAEWSENGSASSGGGGGKGAGGDVSNGLSRLVNGVDDHPHSLFHLSNHHFHHNHSLHSRDTKRGGMLSTNCSSGGGGGGATAGVGGGGGSKVTSGTCSDSNSSSKTLQPSSRWQTYQRVRQNRQSRLSGNPSTRRHITSCLSLSGEESEHSHLTQSKGLLRCKRAAIDDKVHFQSNAEQSKQQHPHQHQHQQHQQQQQSLLISAPEVQSNLHHSRSQQQQQQQHHQQSNFSPNHLMSGVGGAGSLTTNSTPVSTATSPASTKVNSSRIWSIVGDIEDRDLNRSKVTSNNSRSVPLLNNNTNVSHFSPPLGNALTSSHHHLHQLDLTRTILREDAFHLKSELTREWLSSQQQAAAASIM